MTAAKKPKKPSKSPGKMIFQYSDGDEVFELESATLRITKKPGPSDRGEFKLFFSVRAKDGPQRSTRPGPDYGSTAPDAEVYVFLKKCDVENLVGRTFKVAKAWNEKRWDHVAAYYYYEHDNLDKNVVEIVKKTPSGFQVLWTGVARNLCDKHKQLKIDATFELEVAQTTID